MSMLRHIRMSNTKDAATSKQIPAKVFLTARQLMRPLFQYVVPRPSPQPGAPERVCHCRYPLYTLCSPQVSPYDRLADAVSGTRSYQMSEVVAPLETPPEELDLKALEGQNGNNNSSSNSDQATEIAKGASPENNHSMNENTAAVVGSVASSPPAEATGSKRGRPKPSWRGRLSSKVYRPTNVVPGKPPCYRCEICDGFQQDVEDDEDEEVEVMKKATLAGSPTTAIGSQACAKEVDEKEDDEDAEVDGDDEDEEESRLTVSTSTDITNTTMEDTEVAHLRYQDPFLVEVLGRPSIAMQSRKLSRQFQQQLRRCNISAKELTLFLPDAMRTSERHNQEYEEWVEQQKQQSLKERAQRRKQEYLRQCVVLLDIAAYTVRFAVASYGLPYELGYFNSVLEMTKLMAEPHRRYSSATSEEQMESMRRMLQGEEYAPLMEFALSRYSTEIARPSFSVVVDHEAKRVVVAFRGTETLADAVVDITEGYVVVDLLATGPTILGVEVGAADSVKDVRKAPAAVRARLERLLHSVHRKGGEGQPKAHRARAAAAPFLASPKYSLESEVDGATVSTEDNTPTEKATLGTRVPLGFYESTVEAATVLLPALEKIYDQYPHYDLFITGHSLGGIQATLFHLFFCFSGSPSAYNVIEDSSSNSSSGNAGSKAQPRAEESTIDKNKKILAEQKHRHKYDKAAIAARWRVPYPRVFTITFGAAPVVEQRVLAEVNGVLREEERQTGSRMIHFMFGKDAVGRLQVRAIRDLYNPSATSPTTTTTATATTSTSNAASSPSKRKSERAGESKGGNVLTGKPSTVAPTPDDAALPTLAIPGSVYNIPYNTHKHFFEVAEDAPIRTGLIANVDSVFHHFPLFYVRCVNHLLKYYTSKWVAQTVKEADKKRK